MNAQELTSRYPKLSDLDEAGQALLAQAHRVELPADTVIFRHGDRCDHFVMLVSGHVKVVARSPAGRELLLYRINHQGTCVLTTSCLLGNEHYPAEGIAETDVVAYLLPRSVFQQALDRSPALRTFIFDSYAERLSGLIHLVQAVSFESVEQRLVGPPVRRGWSGCRCLSGRQAGQTWRPQLHGRSFRADSGRRVDRDRPGAIPRRTSQPRAPSGGWVASALG